MNSRLINLYKTLLILWPTCTLAKQFTSERHCINLSNTIRVNIYISVALYKPIRYYTGKYICIYQQHCINLSDTTYTGKYIYQRHCISLTDTLRVTIYISAALYKPIRYYMGEHIYIYQRHCINLSETVGKYIYVYQRHCINLSDTIQVNIYISAALYKPIRYYRGKYIYISGTV